jgi:hypothetical protein
LPWGRFLQKNQGNYAIGSCIKRAGKTET